MTAPILPTNQASAIGELWRRVQILEAVFPTGGMTGLWGAIFNDGGIISGTGFTADNDYGDGINFTKITFDTPFTNPPVVLLAANNNNPDDTQGRYGVSLVDRDVSFITVRMDAFDTVSLDNGGFDFLCLEPGV